MNNLKQAIAEVVLSIMTKHWYEAAVYGQSQPYDPSKLHEDIAAAILDMPEIRQALQNTVALDRGVTMGDESLPSEEAGGASLAVSSGDVRFVATAFSCSGESGANQTSPTYTSAPMVLKPYKGWQIIHDVTGSSHHVPSGGLLKKMCDLYYGTAPSPLNTLEPEKTDTKCQHCGHTTKAGEHHSHPCSADSEHPDDIPPIPGVNHGL